MADQRFSRFPLTVSSPSGKVHLCTEDDREKLKTGDHGPHGWFPPQTKCGREITESWGEPQERTLMSGFDLDHDETMAVSFAQAELRKRAVESGGSVRGLFGACFHEGLLIGLLIAEARAKGGES